MPNQIIRAWHFTNGRVLRDGKKWRVGNTERHSGKLELCQSGLHASRNILDALKYAPGTMIRRVECGGRIEEEYDKLVCAERKVLWAYDAKKVLHHFARLCALDVIHLWKAPKIVIQYLRTGDDKLKDSAYSAAYSAYSAACSVAYSAYSSTYYSAAASAAYSGVYSAVYSTDYSTYYSTYYAAYYAARSGGVTKQKQNKRLARMLLEGRKR